MKGFRSKENREMHWLPSMILEKTREKKGMKEVN
jgi:hypothetical protein